MKLFAKWETDGITVEDPGLQPYIETKFMYLPKTSGRNFTKLTRGKKHLVERLINKLMVPGHRGKKHKFTSGHCTGKYATAFGIVEKAFAMVEKSTGKNPLMVFVKAVENGAPREEITTIEYGGARYPKAVECSPLRRIDVVLRYIVQGAYSKSFNKKKSISSCLASEIVHAFQLNAQSNAIAKKNELERQADSSR
ncbi:30S ribosomal protein S7 [archaeon]|nr:30S ribosomal protein S7 [archaeon]|tara:strand:- start:417 stop:1004 length:588 start_codon:yes stop_codon:yes gene_type:complete